MAFPTPSKGFKSFKYRLLGLVGQGQFGQVYCAVHRETGRLVALKNINRDRLPTHRFLRELRFLLSLEHSHIANCHALEQSATGRQLVLDYCEAGTLRDLIEQSTPLSLAEILTLIVDVLRALEHAQEKGIIHCDIKPENILLSLTATGWLAKVSDFGIARLGEELQGDRSAIGSPAYMSPERFYHQYAQSSDTYAVGVVLFELLMGDRPFSGSYDQLMVAHLNHSVNVPETLPPAVRSVVVKSLEKLMARRFRSAAEMEAAIQTARKTLTASELRERFPFQMDRKQTQFVSPAELTYPHRCRAIAILGSSHGSTVLLSTSETHIWTWSLTAEGHLESPQPCQTWSLGDTVYQLLDTSNGAVAATHNALYQLSVEPPPPLAVFDDLIRVLPGGSRWLTVQCIESANRFWLVDTLKRVPAAPRAFEISPAQGQSLTIPLGDRHFLAADVTDTETVMRVFTRWGKPMGQMSLRTPLLQLFPTKRPFQVLAQAGTYGHDLLFIQVKPYRVKRCRLDITADWVGELAIGYVVVSNTGQMQVVSFDGRVLGSVNGLPVPTAIACQPPFHIWLSNEQDCRSQLFQIDVRTLDLDIAF